MPDSELINLAASAFKNTNLVSKTKRFTYLDVFPSKNAIILPLMSHTDVEMSDPDSSTTKFHLEAGIGLRTTRLKMEPHGVFKEVTKQCTNKDHYQSVEHAPIHAPTCPRPV